MVFLSLLGLLVRLPHLFLLSLSSVASSVACSFALSVGSSVASVVADSVASSVAFPVASSSFFLSLLQSPGQFLLMSLPWSPSPSLLLSLGRSPIRSPRRSLTRSPLLLLPLFFFFFFRSVVSFGDSCLFVYFCFLCFSSFSSVSWSLPSVVFFSGHLVWSSSLSSRLSHPLSSSLSSAAASVPTASVVSGVAFSAFGGGLDGSSSRDIFSVTPVPEDSVAFFRSFGISR